MLKWALEMLGIFSDWLNLAQGFASVIKHLTCSWRWQQQRGGAWGEYSGFVQSLEVVYLCNIQVKASMPSEGCKYWCSAKHCAAYPPHESLCIHTLWDTRSTRIHTHTNTHPRTLYLSHTRTTQYHPHHTSFVQKFCDTRGLLLTGCMSVANSLIYTPSSPPPILVLRW